LVFYADESLISLIPPVGKTWTFPQAHPIVRVSGKRGQHVGITAAVNRGGRLCFELTREKERFTSKTFLRFIRKLRREFPTRPILLIVDGAPIHKAKVVKAFQEENTSWFCLEILPAYSPELNPTEKSWGFVKTKKLNASQAKDKTELRQNVKKAMRETKKDNAKVASFFGDGSTVPDYFLASKGRICRCFPLRKRISRRHKSWMAPDSTLPTPPKASRASKTFPRRRDSSGRVITGGGPAHAADTGPTDCGPTGGCCTTWAIRCPAGRERLR